MFPPLFKLEDDEYEPYVSVFTPIDAGVDGGGSGGGY
jgi:hypothetical protein